MSVDVYELATKINSQCGTRKFPIDFRITHPLFRQRVQIIHKVHVLEVRGLLGVPMLLRYAQQDDNTVVCNRGYKVLVPKDKTLTSLENIQHAVILIPSTSRILKREEFVQSVINSNNYYLVVTKAQNNLHTTIKTTQ